MLSRGWATMVLVMLATVGLAGCAGDDGGLGSEGTPLAAGKGAIAGLLVDDRFRPIHLTDSPQTEFQTTGFVLLQETGQQVQTTENGEFTFSNLDPGTYTLRVTANGYEAVPQKVAVQEDVFNEVSVVARRVLSEGNVIITEHYSGFSSCFLNYVLLSSRPDCTGDRSGDTSRSGFLLNYSQVGDVSWVVMETLFNQEPRAGSSMDLVARGGFAQDFTSDVLWEGRYSKMHLQHGAISPDPQPVGTEHIEWTNQQEISLEMFGRGYLAEEIRTSYSPVYEAIKDLGCIGVGSYCPNQWSFRRGAGATFGVEAQFVISVFLGEPEVDPLDYCVLCE